eukprot:15017976-Alexandrium_andersonii.AAC.1
MWASGCIGRAWEDHAERPAGAGPSPVAGRGRRPQDASTCATRGASSFPAEVRRGVPGAIQANFEPDSGGARR